MTAAECLTQERIWFDKPHYDEAERQFYERMNGPTQPKQDTGANSILQDIARARENIQKSLAGVSRAKNLPLLFEQFSLGGGGAADYGELTARMKNLELENQSLHNVVEELRSALSKMESRVSALEKRLTAPTVNGTGPASPQKAPPAPAKQEEEDEDEDDIDLFGSDEEVDEEAERLKEQRLQEYTAKKAKKPALIAKSSILLDVKPWDDETDMAKLEECVRSVQVDGLLWGASKLVPVGYGIKKLQINCVVEDDKVGTDFLEEEITKFEDYVSKNKSFNSVIKTFSLCFWCLKTAVLTLKLQYYLNGIRRFNSHASLFLTTPS
uniref:Elongation factor 1-delta-like n=1 Tax=Sinocyclocheilus anshuiensis TaxID=1608454 RepID=A0A671SN71_9TELE